jgi:hypothetical protein
MPPAGCVRPITGCLSATATRWSPTTTWPSGHTSSGLSGPTSMGWLLDSTGAFSWKRRRRWCRQMRRQGRSPRQPPPARAGPRPRLSAAAARSATSVARADSLTNGIRADQQGGSATGGHQPRPARPSQQTWQGDASPQIALTCPSELDSSGLIPMTVLKRPTCGRAGYLPV